MDDYIHKSMERLAAALTAHEQFCRQYHGIAPSVKAHPDSLSYKIAIEYESAVKQWNDAKRRMAVS